MLFNSFEYMIFFPIVWVLYWNLSFRLQNSMLLIASYIFYAFWDWRFLSLLMISTFVDYVAGLKIENTNIEKKRKMWLALSIFSNLGMLGFFKYFNFFVGSLEDLLSFTGLNVEMLRLHIILPVGISFYTFQTLSYSIDIYRKKMKATKNLLDLALYVAFFPQLVAGPIERAINLLPKISSKRTFNKSQFYEGLHLILWGLFKKVFVADNLAPYIDKVFANPSPTGWEVLFGGWAFAIQVYGDFSGYSDVARGCAKCLGIDLMVNFNHPYVAINPVERWKRWHISLSTWLRDYLYISMGGNRHGTLRTYRNLFATMLLGGLWHGAAWNFVLWGAWEGLLIVVHRLIHPIIEKISIFKKLIPNYIGMIAKIILMFHLVSMGLIIFRGHSLTHIIDMMSTLFFIDGVYGAFSLALFAPLLKFGTPLFLFEKMQYSLTKDKWSKIETVPSYVKCGFYSVIFYLIVFYGASAQSFIYFQF